MEEAQDGEPALAELESQLRLESTLLTVPAQGECLACYVMRMLEFGCHGLQWATRYRDQVAARATALEQNLSAMGGYCDCGIFMNAYDPNPAYFAVNTNGDLIQNPMPPCLKVRAGSVQPCALWMRRRRW
jgi:hypothetical protein